VTPRDIPAALWLAFVIAILPWLSFVQARKLTRVGVRGPVHAGLPRTRLYRLSVLSMAQFLVVSVLLDWIDGFATVRKSLVFPRHGVEWIVACIAAHQVIALTTMLLRRVRGVPLEAGTMRLLPRNRSELVGFLPLALMAGISEEFMYRGFVPDHLFHWGLPLWLAFGIATLSFGLAHGYKSLAGMMRTALMGLVTVAPVIATGTLLPSMIAHTLIDVIAGTNTLRLARWLGVAIPEPAPAAAAAAAVSSASPGA
jgi:membrane protease YdiL (CAAX protease family)